MRFNISKCFVMRVTQSQVLHDYQLHNSTLNSVNHCKIWGLYFSLICDGLIEEITAKANSSFDMIRRNVKKAPKSVREQIYQTLIRPQLET